MGVKEITSPFPWSSYESLMFVKKNRYRKKNCVYALKVKHASHKMEMKTDRFQEIIIFVEYFAESLEMETLSS